MDDIIQKHLRIKESIKLDVIPSECEEESVTKGGGGVAPKQLSSLIDDLPQPASKQIMLQSNALSPDNMCDAAVEASANIPLSKSSKSSGKNLNGCFEDKNDGYLNGE